MAIKRIAEVFYDAHEAKKVPAKLSTSAVTRVAAVPATKRSPWSGTKLSTPAAAKGGSEKEKTARTKEKKEEGKEKREASYKPYSLSVLRFTTRGVHILQKE